MFKTVVFAFGIFITAPVVAEAQSLDTTCEVWSKYHGSDGNVFDEDPSVQCSATLSADSGLYGGVWVAQDFDNVTDFGDEIDFYVGYGGELGGGFTFDASLQYFALSNFGDVWNSYIQISAPSIELMNGVNMTPYVKFDHYFPVGDDPAAGTLIRVGPAFNADLGNSWSLGFDPQVFHDDGAFGNYEGYVLFANASLGYAFENGVSVAGLVRYSTPFDGDDFRQSETSFALQVSKPW